MIHHLVGLERELKGVKVGTRKHEAMMQKYRKLLLACIGLENDYLDANKQANTKTLDLLQSRYDDLEKR